MAAVNTDPGRTGEGLYISALAAQRAGRFADAVQLLGQASRSGHVGAMTLLGGQLLFGRGAAPDPQEGLSLIVRAAELGGGSACNMAATLSASGAVGPQDWARALDYLQRGAAAGYPAAQEQLKLLADPSGKSTVRLSWAQMRRRVSLEAWRKAPEFRVLSADPDIKTAEAFTDKAVCDWIIGRARDRLQPASVIANQGEGQDVRAGVRTNSYAGFDLITTDVVLLLMRERLAAVAGVDILAMEAPQALHYSPGEQYRPHFDFMDPKLSGHVEALARLGQRSLTLLVYLNDAYEGGETDFPRLGLKYRGPTGGLLMFRNADDVGKPDRRMLHAGLAPTSGEKWLLSQWIRDRLAPP